MYDTQCLLNHCEPAEVPSPRRLGGAVATTLVTRVVAGQRP